MFYRVSHARHVALVAEISDIDVKGGRRLVRVGIMYEKGLELIGQADDAVCAVIERGSLELVGYSLDLGLPVLPQDKRFSGRTHTEVLTTLEAVRGTMGSASGPKRRS